MSFCGLMSLQAAQEGEKKVLIVNFGMHSNGLQVEHNFPTEDLVNALAEDPYFKSVEQLKIENWERASSVKPLISELIKNEKVQKSNYLIIIETESINLSRKGYKKTKITTDQEATNEQAEESEELNGKYVINLRIVEVNTGKVIYADKISQTKIECNEANEKVTMEQFFKKLEEDVLTELKTRILETFMPIRVARVYQQYAYLDRGVDTGLKLGMKLCVFIPSRPIVDSRTGEIIGDMEYCIGELKVIEVLPKNIRAQIVKYSRPIEVGFTCRTIFEPEDKKCSN